MIEYTPFRSPSPTAGVRRLTRVLVAIAEGVGFWAAVALPFVYLPLVVVRPDPSVLAAGVALNAVALLVGHGYGASSFDSRHSGPDV